MNRNILVIFFLLVMAGCTTSEYYVSTSFHEPAKDGLRFIYSRDGIHWDSIAGTFLRPEVGDEKVMRDPSIVRASDGTFHLVWTSSWRGDLGFGYASSNDLIHWSAERHIKVMDDTTTVNVWAPELFYDDEMGQYLIVWSSCVPGKFPDGEEEHKNNHRLYYTTTKDFVKFAPTKLFMDPGFSVIDATLLKHGKGDYVAVIKDNTRPQRNIKVCFAKTPYGPWSKASKAFSEPMTEGPTVAKVGDYYYIYYDCYRKFRYGASRTKDFINFEDVTDSIQVPAGHKHGTIFMAPSSIVKGLIGK
jgi:beta-xylosidase